MNTHKQIRIQNQRGEKCIYCFKPPTDKDHVICRNLFPDKGKGLSLIKVPSCHECNLALSSDEEFFRLFIAGISLDWSDKARTVFDTSIKRQLEKRPALAKKMFDNMSLVNIETPSGIYTGQKATAQHVSKQDWDRLYRVVEKTVRGLMFTLHNQLIDDKYEMKTFLGWNENIKPFLPYMEYFEPQDYYGIFCFGYALVVDAPPVSVWFTSYYDRMTFCTFINKRGSFSTKQPAGKKRILNLLN